MSKLHSRGYLAISTIAAASALLVVAPAGASAAEGSADGSTSGETATEPSGDSTQPATPAGTEWTPQAGEGEKSGGGSPPLEHGSSVGSGTVTGKAGSDSGESSNTSDSSGSYEPEPSIPSTVDEPANTPRAGSGGGVHSAQPKARATPARASRPVDVGVGAATSLGRTTSAQGDGIDSATPPAAASFGGSSDRASANSYALPLLIIVVLGLIFGFAGVRLRRRRRRRQLEALWREQDAEWEAALRRAELEQASGASEPSAETVAVGQRRIGALS
jgi:hypothetical protein